MSQRQYVSELSLPVDIQCIFFMMNIQFINSKTNLDYFPSKTKEVFCCWEKKNIFWPNWIHYFILFFLSTAEVGCFLFSTKYLLIAVESDLQAKKKTGFHGNPGNFYAKSDNSFSSSHSWDLPKGVSHLLLHCHLLCSIVPHGPGLYSDMSQAVVSAGQ